ncbi:hypothetical protein H6F89_18360 [Cyanobacteria bacterium FACHB-63]|nr:hypothetical protein [Cyanobacteria bacterium FACHB-63]
MTRDEIIAVLEQKGFTKIEFSDESILADLGLGNGEYWLTIVPPSDDGDWLRVRLTEAGEGEPFQIGSIKIWRARSQKCY